MLSSLRKLLGSDRPAAYHRRGQRIFMSEPVRLIMGRGTASAAMLEQISTGGARVTTSKRLAPGTSVELEFTTSAGERHSLRAQVVHALKEERGFNWHCGLRFVDAAPQEIRRLADFIEAESKRRQVGFAMSKT